MSPDRSQHVTARGSQSPDGVDDEDDSEPDPFEEGAAFLIIIGFLYGAWRALLWVLSNWFDQPAYAVGKFVVVSVGALVAFSVTSWVVGKILIALQDSAEPWLGGDEQ